MLGRVQLPGAAIGRALPKVIRLLISGALVALLASVIVFLWVIAD